jgi:hypothetical protein
MKIIITERQLKYINEALGVPDNILEAAEAVFDIFLENIKSITDKQSEYHFDGDLDIELGDKKKIKIDGYELEVTVNEFSQIKGKPVIISMGMGQSFRFDREVMMKRVEESTTAEFEIEYGVGEEWEPYELYETLMDEKGGHLSSLAHELKHKYDKQAKELDLVGRDADYTANQRRSTFGISVIDHQFFRFMYFISVTENLVRQTELASEMKSKKITKSQFREFLENQKVYKELIEIKNFSYEKLIEGLYEEMDSVDGLLNHIGEDPSEMTDEEKIKRVLEIVYINISNIRVGTFMEMIRNKEDEVKDFLRQLTGKLPSFLDDDEDREKMDNLKRNFINYVGKYQKNPIKFFQDECENFSYMATKVLKRIGKLYGLAKDDEQVSESIINWELHQQLMEKKYGKRKIQTEYKFKR